MTFRALVMLAILGLVYLLVNAIKYLRAQRKLGTYYFWDTLKLWGLLAGLGIAFLHSVA